MPDSTSLKPLCFVAMPFGVKLDEGGREIQFDEVYKELIVPAVEGAGMDCIRADHERTGGMIHKAMFERLVLCPYVVADLSTANPNVFYEVGVRHAVRPYSTVLTFAKDSRLPFDVAPLRAVPYALNVEGGPSTAKSDSDLLRDALLAAQSPVADSPLFQLLDGMPTPDLARLKTDVFRERVNYSQTLKQALSTARKSGTAAVLAMATEVQQAAGGNMRDVDAGILVDILLSLRATSAWEEMLEHVEAMAPEVSGSVLVREQQAFALNRLGKRDSAEEILVDLIERRGPSSETLGLLGRVYKDRWQTSLDRGDDLEAVGYLRRAIDTYLAGFEADWRDAYPGVNAVTLMHIAGDPRRNELIPVVRYAAERRRAHHPDYWDHATVLELAVLAGDYAGAMSALIDALASVRESWEPKTTANNLGMIRDAHIKRGEDTSELAKIIGALKRRAERK